MPPGSAIFALGIHADYRCGHSGACCSTPWDVPVEASAHRAISFALADGRVTVAEAPFVTGPGLPAGVAAVLQRNAAGACTFLDDARLCAVHRALGEGALPTACRLFPRIALTDARGTFITLSHYCPTAARALLRSDVSLAIVADPPAFPPGDYEGLDAADAWPPSVRPGLLMGLPAYDAWEQRAVRLFATPGLTPETVIATLARDAESLCGWRPGGVSLEAAVAALPEPAPSEPALSEADPRLGDEPVADLGDQVASLAWHRTVWDAVPDGLGTLMPSGPVDGGWAFVHASWAAFALPVSRYLAAHAFGNWCAYQGSGLRAWVRSVQAARAVLLVECARVCAAAAQPLDDGRFVAAVRASDLVLRHLASREALAAAWSSDDGVPATPRQSRRAHRGAPGTRSGLR